MERKKNTEYTHSTFVIYFYFHRYDFFFACVRVCVCPPSCVVRLPSTREVGINGIPLFWPEEMMNIQIVSTLNLSFSESDIFAWNLFLFVFVFVRSKISFRFNPKEGMAVFVNSFSLWMYKYTSFVFFSLSLVFLFQHQIITQTYRPIANANCMYVRANELMATLSWTNCGCSLGLSK